jgi:hypothetical protein
MTTDALYKPSDHPALAPSPGNIRRRKDTGADMALSLSRFFAGAQIFDDLLGQCPLKTLKTWRKKLVRKCGGGIPVQHFGRLACATCRWG